MAFKIGKNFHIIHMTDDLKQLDAWYYDIFSVQRFMPDSYGAAEVRDASLVLIGELCVEPLAPAFRVEGWDKKPLGRFYNRRGKRFHSLAWYVDSGIDELYRSLKAAGVRCYGTAGVTLGGDLPPDGVFFTHPRDTYTQLEFVGRPIGDHMRDPRLQPGWSPEWWAERHPLQLQAFSHATVSTRDVGRARDVYVSLLDGELVYEGEIAHSQTNSAFVLVGDDLMVELAQPMEDSSPMAQDLEQHHEGLYSLSYKVRDLDQAEEYLTHKGVKAIMNDGTTLVTDPATTFGCVMRFTTWNIPGDPRPDWSASIPEPALTAESEPTGT
jgi:hypothetical protein